MKIWIILLITSAFIVPFLILFLWYLGYFRFYELKKNSLESYSKKYKKLKKINDKIGKKQKIGRVIISLTTIPSHVKKMRNMLKSILDQTVRVNKIYLNIPENKEYDIPQDYNEVLSVMKCGKDYGICSKFIPTMLKEDNANTIIIMLKDNLIYGKDYIEKILKHYLKKPDESIVSKSGIILKPNFIDEKFIEEKNNSINYKEEWIIDTIKVNKRDFKYSKNFKIV